MIYLCAALSTSRHSWAHTVLCCNRYELRAPFAAWLARQAANAARSTAIFEAMRRYEVLLLLTMSFCCRGWKYVEQ
jgi:hypothetical protein